MKVQDLFEEHSVEWLMEASYQGNIGMMELSKFMSMASPQEKASFKVLMARKQTKKVWELVQRVTGMELQGAQFNR